MRLEYTFNIDEVAIPRFAVEAVEGIAKLFTLGTLMLNVLDVKPKVELVFHGLNPEDPGRKLEAFKRIVAAASTGHDLVYTEGEGGAVPGSSSCYLWVTVQHGGQASA